jgi:hypothetical protein
MSKEVFDLRMKETSKLNYDSRNAPYMVPGLVPIILIYFVSQKLVSGLVPRLSMEKRFSGVFSRVLLHSKCVM